MYTNTPWDNHFKGTDPFLIADPTVERGFVAKYINPYINPILLTFGMWGNYWAHLLEMIQGNENVTLGKLCLPFTVGCMVHQWGWQWALLLMYVQGSVIGVYYFTLALMNHNAEKTMQVDKRNKARDWGEA